MPDAGIWVVLRKNGFPSPTEPGKTDRTFLAKTPPMSSPRDLIFAADFAGHGDVVMIAVEDCVSGSPARGRVTRRKNTIAIEQYASAG